MRTNLPAPTAATTPSPREIPATPSPPPSPAEAPKPAAERFNSALRRNEPLQSAARALAVIDSMSAEDFRHLGEPPGSFHDPSAYGFDRDFSDAVMNALIERWLAVDPAGAVAGVQAMEKKLIIKPGSAWAGTGQFRSALARVRPEALLDALPEKAVWDRADVSLGTAFTMLAKRDLAAARAYLDRFADPEQRKFGEYAIAKGVAENDPLAGVALARTLESAEVFGYALEAAKTKGIGAVREVLIANAKKFPVGSLLPDLVLRDPDEDWAALTGDASADQRGVPMEAFAEADRLTPEERERRLAALDRLPPNLRENIASALISAWAKDDPRAAAEWSIAHVKAASGGSNDGGFLNVVLGQWITADQAAVIEWCQKLPASPQRDEIENAAAGWLAYAGNVDAAMQLLHPQPGGKTAGTIASIAAARAKDEPSAAAAWLDSLPQNIDTSEAAKSLVKTWAKGNIADAANWVEAQPAGSRRDAALQAYTQVAAELDPAAAGEWVATIGDTTARTKAAEFVFGQWNARDPSAARAWLRGLPGVDPALSDRIIRLQR